MLERDPQWVQQDDEAGEPFGPGAKLRAAREAANLSVEEVAKKLRLDQQMVTEIEADDFSRGPALIYVRGYLRAYSRLLGVSAMDILQAFNAMGWHETQQSERPRIAHSEMRRQKSLLQRSWLGLIAILVILLLAVLWWAV